MLVAHLRRMHRRLNVLVGDVLEEAPEVNLLPIAGAENAPRLLTGDRENRLVIELGVVEAVQRMDRPRARGHEAHTETAAELGVRASHQGRRLLVADLDELEAIPGASQRARESVDAVPGIAVDPAHAPRGKPVNHKIGDVHAIVSILEG
jgi:hypothetical protein